MIRELNESDIPFLVNIEIATQLSPWSEDVFLKCLLLGSQAWVAIEQDRIIGFIMVFAKAGEAHILNLGVHPDDQRKGYGQALLQTAIDFAKKEQVISLFLEVRVSNHPAILLYKKMGFSQIGLRKQYYPLNETGREDALVFAKRFETS